MNIEQANQIDQIRVLERSPNLAGVDEVGRGALFGSVVAAAVILPDHAFQTLAEAGVKDSKRLSSKRRIQLDLLIRAVAARLVWLRLPK
jgi:ribonuclease HII